MRSLTREIANALTIMFISAACLIGCSAGGDVAGGGIGGTGVTVSSVGTITGFGSVILNGVTYDTTAAEVIVDNIPKGSGDQAVVRNLSAGMVVRVEGRFEDGGRASADRIFFSNNLKGPVESVSPIEGLSRHAVILGQTIRMDDRTRFRDAALESIAVGMVLEVSGHLDESDDIVATYVSRVADAFLPDGPVEIKGMVQNLIPGLKTFKIQRLTVDYSESDLSSLPGSSLEVGQLLRVRGRLESTNRLVAERMEPEEEFGSGAFDWVDLEGIITRTGSDGELRIGRYTIRVDAETSYIDLSPQDLGRGTRVIVQGSLADRVIFADKISRSVRPR